MHLGEISTKPYFGHLAGAHSHYARATHNGACSFSGEADRQANVSERIYLVLSPDTLDHSKATL